MSSLSVKARKEEEEEEGVDLSLKSNNPTLKGGELDELMHLLDLGLELPPSAYAPNSSRTRGLVSTLLIIRTTPSSRTGG